MLWITSSLRDIYCAALLVHHFHILRHKTGASSGTSRDLSKPRRKIAEILSEPIISNFLLWSGVLRGSRTGYG